MPMTQAAAGPWRHQPFQPGTLLPHLAGPAGSVRQAMAAHFVAGCEHVIEIGGAGLPITGFLRPAPRAITVIDPKIEPYEAEYLDGAPCRVRHIAAKLQSVALAPPAERYGLVLLGLSLKPSGSRPPLGAELLALAAGAEIVVVEHAVALERAAPQAAALLEGLSAEVLADIAMDIRDTEISGTPFGRRRFVVLRPGKRP